MKREHSAGRLQGTETGSGSLGQKRLDDTVFTASGKITETARRIRKETAGGLQILEFNHHHRIRRHCRKQTGLAIRGNGRRPGLPRPGIEEEHSRRHHQSKDSKGDDAGDYGFPVHAYLTAIASISIFTPIGSAATWKHALAGLSSVKNSAYTAFAAAKFLMSSRRTVVLTTLP